jgi:thiol-disulfide isomerase/thioredoxin
MEMRNDRPVPGAANGGEARRGLLTTWSPFLIVSRRLVEIGSVGRRSWLVAFLLIAGAACRPGDNAQWAIVQEYLDRQAAWEARAGAIRDILVAGPGPVEEKIRRAEDVHGEMPDATPAIAAAREIVAAGGPRTAEAAVFLIDRSESLLGSLDTQRKLAKLVADGMAPADAIVQLRGAEDPTWEALIAHIGPDWRVVESYLDSHDAWAARLQTARESSDSPHSSAHERPNAVPAVAAALAMVEAEGVQEKTVEAAEFLIDHAGGRDRYLAIAAGALAAHAPQYEHWPRILRSLDSAHGAMRTSTGRGPAIDEFFTKMAADSDHLVLRAAARYYLATGLRRAANASMLSSEERAAHRERAQETAMGLSAGVEDEPFDDSDPGPGGAAPDRRTFAEAEADLLATIRHATVGGTLPEWTGRRLDGAKQPLSDYRGRVLMIDFWATWCPPCIAVLPDLRQLVSDLPSDKFALLAISVDAELATVTDFMEKEPMPWDNWHVGVSSEIERLLGVRGFPTYLIADADGAILFNGNAFFPVLRCMVEEAVAGEDLDCAPRGPSGAP